MGSSQSSAASAATSSAPAACPMPSKNQQQDDPIEISSLNRMPTTAQQMTAPGQSIVLPVQRTISSIPRSTANIAAGSSTTAGSCPVASTSTATTCPVYSSSTASSASPAAAAVPLATTSWEYPSPQQFYNALVRKGWETPEESIVMMVDIHNWLNEEAWQQVRVWEEKHDGGDRSQLARFEGRPQDLSPKARYHLFLGSILPSRFGYVKPFDRHDWLIHRPTPPPPSSPSSSSYTAPSSTQAYTTHRYVIDYYSLPDDAQGNPCYSLDVRPAVDDFAAVRERLGVWWQAKKESWSSVGQDVGTGVGVKVQEEK